MPLCPLNELLASARAGAYAVCYCESWNLESLQAVIEAAEESAAPIIAGFNGGFLMHSTRSKPERLSYYGSLVSALRQSTVPVSFILNETNDLAQIQAGIELGFNAVMVENEGLALEEYAQLVKKVVRFARAKNVSVEAQIGRLPNGCESGRDLGETTDPYVAKAFVVETGVDALGVAIGNVHILTEGKTAIDVSALEKIRGQVDVPFVVHGGTGFPQDRAAEVIRLGVAKFNFGTTLKQAYLATIREKLRDYSEPMNPHPFLGMGGPKDVLIAGREAVKRRVKELIEGYGFALCRRDLHG